MIGSIARKTSRRRLWLRVCKVDDTRPRPQSGDRHSRCRQPMDFGPQANIA